MPKFKNKLDYDNQRKALLDEAQRLTDEKKLVEAGAKVKEVKTLDNEWQEYAVSLANEEALRGKIASLQNIGAGETTHHDPILNQGHIQIENDLDYRKAFMNYVTKGEKIPSQFQNVDASTKTTDIGAIIPTTVLDRIIEKMETHGQILARVTKTSYRGGVTIPTSTAKPIATWVAEGAGSEKQKKTTGTITFAYHKLRCAVSVSLETDTMALSVFESTIVNNINEALVKAIEASIVTGTGNGQPKGILKETVEAGQNIDIAATGDLIIETIEDAEAVLPLPYESGAIWMMNKKTYLKAKTLKDENGQYIFRETRGVNGSTSRMLNEREVVLSDQFPNITDTVTEDTVVAALFRLEDYMLNTNYNIGISEYTDNETDDKIRKAIMLVDGKVVDKSSLVTITKKKA